MNLKLDIPYWIFNTVLENFLRPSLWAEPKFDEVRPNQRHSVLGQTHENNFQSFSGWHRTCRPAIGLDSLKSVEISANDHFY